jgi:hypothetical protein
MEFLHASIALLASMVLVLAGMVGWLYWQQTRLFQNMNSIVMVIGELARPPPSVIPEETEVVPTTTETAPVPVPEPESESKEDDRVSVEKEAETDTDDLEGKTKKELADILTKKGIPFSKSDNKTALISLLKATA